MRGRAAPGRRRRRPRVPRSRLREHARGGARARAVGRRRRRRPSSQQQFAAQDAHYREHYAGAASTSSCVDGEPAGRLYVHASDDEIRIMDIALLPEHRGARHRRRRCCADVHRRGGGGRQAVRSTSSASTPRCGSTSGSAFGRPRTGGFTCSWNGPGGESLTTPPPQRARNYPRAMSRPRQSLSDESDDKRRRATPPAPRA